jgi:Catalase
MSTSPEQIAVDKVKQMALDVAKATKHRDAHPKAHGCVKAQFVVDASKLPKEAQVGVFAQPRTFDAWVRFSSAERTPQPDTLPDVRGIAIKLTGVDGVKILETERDESTQDFILVSTEVFFARNAQEFLIVLGLAKNDPAVEPLRPKFIRELGILAASQESKIRNPLGATYWTTVPFRLGPHRAKYRAVSSSTVAQPADPSSPDFMKEAMKIQLDQDEVRFVFSAQLYEDDATTPIDDPTVPWPTPFVPVATIVIPPQDFTTDERKAFCENLSFTPWHSLPEHEPLGAVNAVRKPVYDAVSAERHKLNSVPRAEPT